MKSKHACHAYLTRHIQDRKQLPYNIYAQVPIRVSPHNNFGRCGKSKGGRQRVESFASIVSTDSVEGALTNIIIIYLTFSIYYMCIRCLERDLLHSNVLPKAGVRIAKRDMCKII